MKFIKNIGYGVWLGGSLAAFGISCLDWRFYVVVVPTVILIIWKYDAVES